MTVILLFIIAALGIMMFPMLIPALLLSFMVLKGVAGHEVINDMKVTVGNTNIFFPDLLFAAAVFLAIFGMFRLLLSGRLRMYAPLTKAAMFLIVCYFMFFVVKLVNGYFNGVPVDSLVRRFSLDTQCVYLFIPLFYLKQEITLKKLLYFVVVLSLLFPLMQPFLYGSADQVSIEKGLHGTLRLGSGYTNLLLMLGVLAFFVWERKLWLSALPLAGIAMLAMRSGFISLTLCVMVLAFQKKKSIKFISLIGIAGVLLVAALVVIQATSSIPVVDKAVERLSQTFEQTGSTKARMTVIPIVLGEVGKRPMVGYSYHDIHVLKLKQERDAFSFNMLHPHNFVLSSLLRSGVLGTLLLFGIIGLVMRSSLRLSRQQDTKEQGMYLFSTILFFVVFGVMNTSFIAVGYMFWILSGVSLWYLNQAHYLKYQQQRNKL